MEAVNNSKKIYKPGKSRMLGGLFILAIVFFGLTLPLLIDGVPAEKNEIVGLIGFWFMGLLITFAPLGFKLEVGNDYVKTFFLNFQIRDLKSSNVQSLEYGNLFRLGGLGVGKGIKVWEKTRTGSRYFSIGEQAYGKEAIAHARKVLEQK